MGSNPRPRTYKTHALPTELFETFGGYRSGVETPPPSCWETKAHDGFQNMEYLDFNPSTLSSQKTRASDCANTPELNLGTRVVQAARIAFTSAPGRSVLCVLFLQVGLVRESVPPSSVGRVQDS